MLHRAAKTHSKLFKGHKIQASSPQGRFAEGAAQLDGQVVDRITAIGKHLFYRFETDDVLHIHLGLFGKFQLHTPPFPDPSENARLLLGTNDNRMHLAGPTACEVLGPDETAAVEKRLGPDPITNPKDGADRLTASLKRRSIPIGRAIMDQKVLAGLGNIFRAEILFLAGQHPFTPANELDGAQVARLWELSVEQLKAGLKANRIITVDPADVGVKSRSKLKRGESLYTYKRQSEPCRRCGDLIRSADIDGRNVWWCPTCQPEA